MKQLFFVTWYVSCNGMRRFTRRCDTFYCECGEQRKLNVVSEEPKAEKPNRWDDMGCYLERET